MKAVSRFAPGASSGASPGASSGPSVGLCVGLVLGVALAAVGVRIHAQDTGSAARRRATQVAVGGGAGGGATDAGAPGSAAADSGAAAGAAGTQGGPAGARRAAASGAAAASTGGASSGHGSVRGVNGNSVTIGVATLDLSAVKYLGPEYDNGDVAGQWNAMVADWRDRHLLPVNGRDVALKFVSYSVLNTDDQRRACAALVDDDQSFAVVAPEFFYQTGADCVAREKKTPLLTSEGPSDDVFQRSAPYLFAVQMSESRLLRNFVRWADARGVLRGHRLGLYYPNDPTVAQLMHDTIGAEMARLGYPAPVEYTTGNKLGGPEDALAVRKFQTSGVDVAALFTSQGGFTQQADAQRYHPKYIQTDYEGGTSDVGTNTYAADQYDGTFAMTTERRGEAASGIPPTTDERACIDNYNRRSGRHVAPPGAGGHETAEFVFVVLACDEGKILLNALRTAGPDLTPASFVAGLESTRALPLIRFPDITFGPDDFQGVEQQRTLQWHGDCTCWRVAGPFGALWTP